MANQFDAGAGVVKQVADVLNDDGTATRVVTVVGVPLHYDFPGSTNVALTCEVQFTFTIPAEVDHSNRTGPLESGISNGCQVGISGAEFEPPAWTE